MRLFTLIILLFFSQFSYSQIQESNTYFIEVGDIRALFSENINLVPKIGYAFSESIATFVAVNRQSEVYNNGLNKSTFLDLSIEGRWFNELAFIGMNFSFVTLTDYYWSTNDTWSYDDSYDALMGGVLLGKQLYLNNIIYIEPSIRYSFFIDGESSYDYTNGLMTGVRLGFRFNNDSQEEISNMFLK